MEKNNHDPSFYKIMFPVPTMSKQMRIPTEFVEYIDESAFKKAMFRERSGRIWPVKLQEYNDGVFVKKGWNRFFEAHSLGNFEFLTFKYDGETCFDVVIFGKDGVNKLEDDNRLISLESRSEDSERDEVYDSLTLEDVPVVDLTRKKGRPSKGNEAMRAVVKDSCTKPDVEKKRRGRPFGSKTKKNDEIQIIDFSGNEDMYVNPVVEKRRRGRPFGSKSKKIGQDLLYYEPHNSKKAEEEEELNIEIKEEIIVLSDDEPSFGFNNSNGNNASRNAFQYNFPFFKICIDLNIADNNYILCLPKPFVKKYFPYKETIMVLKNEKGKSWEVKFYPGGNCFIRGWPEFLRDNEVKHGDRCKFELVTKKEMKVYIFRSENDK